MASLLANDPKISLKVVQTYLGHGDFSTTFNTYAKTEEKAMDNVGLLFKEKFA